MKNPFKYFNSSPEIIRLAVMMYVRFPLSLRNVEDLLHERGIDITHETVRFWWVRFAPMFARSIRKQRVRSMKNVGQFQWHLDEMFVRINGQIHYLWRAIDQEGEVLECYVTKTRNRQAALRFLRKAMKRYTVPEHIITDRLASYKSALRSLGAIQKQQTQRWLNNRAENSHLPVRRKERSMNSFRLMRTLQMFSSVHASIYNHFNLERHLYRRQDFKENRTQAMAERRQLAIG